MSAKRFVDPFPLSTYRSRRQKLVRALSRHEPDFVALFWSGSEQIRNHTNTFPFRAHSDFLYLTGFAEPETLLILAHQKEKTREILGLRPRDLSANRGSEIWEGERVGIERAPKILGVDEAFDIAKVDSTLSDLFSKTRILFWTSGIFEEWDEKLQGLVAEVHMKMRLVCQIEGILDPRPWLHEMRKQKSLDELKIMKASADIAAEGHRRAMQVLKPGLKEYQVEAEVLRTFRYHGAHSISYSPIVAGGNNACVLHYRDNSAELKSGDLLLMDAGAEYHGYASDITRVFPVNGRFSPAQREVYEWVLKAQLAAIRAAKRGAAYHAPHDAATRVLCKALKAMKIIKGRSEAEIFSKGLYKPYFPHGTSHWLGLEVHDVGRYRETNVDRPVRLQVGNVITIEPGLYFRKDDQSVPQKYRGIGIRIEDDVAITNRGPWILSEKCPKTISEIESLCGPRL